MDNGNGLPDRDELLQLAASRGLATFKIASMARSVEVSEKTVKAWLRGEAVRAQTDTALRKLLGCEATEAKP